MNDQANTPDKPREKASPERVTENDLHRLQEEFNRATAKVATTRGNLLRREAEHAEAEADAHTARVNADNLERRLHEAITRFHQQRSVERALANGAGIPADNAATLTAKSAPEGAKVASIFTGKPASGLSDDEREKARAEGERTATQGAEAVRIGDIVRHANGGPEMRVEVLRGDHVTCEWELKAGDVTHGQRAEFGVGVLDLVRRAGDVPKTERLLIVDDAVANDKPPQLFPDFTRRLSDLPQEDVDAAELTGDTRERSGQQVAVWRLPSGEQVLS